MNEKEIIFRKVLDSIDDVMNRMVATHEKPRDFGTGVLLHRVEIHTIQAIAENEGINVTDLAKIMNVTKGAISQTLSKLEKKKLVEKQNSHKNQKEIELYLTDAGWIGYHQHEKMHMSMLRIVEELFGDKVSEKLSEIKHTPEN